MSPMKSTYGAALQVTMRSTAAAYGYTISMGATLSLLTELCGRPDTGRLFLFALGGVLAFALLEAVLAALRTPVSEAPEQAFPYAGALNIVSVAGALGMAVLITHVVRSLLAWFLAPLSTTAIYMVVVAAQVTAVAAGQRRVRAGQRDGPGRR